MQIFVLNIEGKTTTLEVEPFDIIKTVKEKLEAKIGVPHYLQRLSYNCKLLIDEEKTLLHYNIRKESNLRLNLQTWQRDAPGPVSGSGLGLDWNKLANVAKSKIDEEIAKKKLVYDCLVKEKSSKNRQLDQVKVEMRYHEAAELQSSQMIVEKEEEIKVKEHNLKVAQEQLEVIKRERSCLKGQKDMASLKRSAKRDELDNLQVKIARIDEEMNQTFVTAGERLSKENEELVVTNQAMKKFLQEAIVDRESNLECPVCYQVASPPIYKCYGEHLICSSCLPRVKNCPTCRSGFSKSDKKFRLAEGNWRELQKLKSKLEEM